MGKVNKYLPGDIFEMSDGHQTVVMEVNEDFWPIKVKSLEPDPQLGKIGWFQEENDWVIMTYTILENEN